MAFSSIIMLPLLLLFLAIWAGLIYLLILLIRALRKYLRGGEARREKAETRRTLGEVLKAHRMRRRGSMKQSESRGSDISQGAKSLPCEV